MERVVRFPLAYLNVVSHRTDARIHGRKSGDGAKAPCRSGLTGARCSQRVHMNVALRHGLGRSSPSGVWLVDEFGKLTLLALLPIWEHKRADR
jgi:hypothetical protein